MKNVKVRFAPNPYHIFNDGMLGTALFNWLYARHEGGQLILRFEDDRDAFAEQHIQEIVSGLQWAGLEWDEGPYRRTDRVALYQQWAMQLVDRGRAYWCVCTPEELEARRQADRLQKKDLKYDGRCRERGITSPSEEPAVLRFRWPHVDQTDFHDLIQGPCTFTHAGPDDWVILGPNATPTHHFCTVVDDVVMGITHVIRGRRELPITPRHIHLFEAFDCPVPQFAHLPEGLETDGPPWGYISVDRSSVGFYRKRFYSPEGLLNALFQLGLSSRDKDVLSREEMIQSFSLDGIRPTSGRLSLDKVEWMSKQHLKRNSS